MKTVILITILNFGTADEVRVHNRIEGTMEQCHYAIATRQAPPNVKYRCSWLDANGKIRSSGHPKFRLDELPYVPRG